MEEFIYFLNSHFGPLKQMADYAYKAKAEELNLRLKMCIPPEEYNTHKSKLELIPNFLKEGIIQLLLAGFSIKECYEVITDIILTSETTVLSFQEALENKIIKRTLGIAGISV